MAGPSDRGVERVLAFSFQAVMASVESRVYAAASVVGNLNVASAFPIDI